MILAIVVWAVVGIQCYHLHQLIWEGSMIRELRDELGNGQ